MMNANVLSWRVCFLISLLLASFALAQTSRAQRFVVIHPRVAIPIAPTGPIVQSYHPSGVAPPIRAAAKPLVAQLGTACGSAASQPAPIQAIVIALKCDPDLIFEYIYNNIEFEPLYGSNKGALGTLLDRRGGDADQAILLVTLWNAAGLTQTGYVNSTYLFDGDLVANWLGVPNDANAIVNLLNGGGIPVLGAWVNPDGTLALIEFLHFEAALNIGGTWYYFDPSFKQHAILPGTSSLSSALGYNRAQFLADAGGTLNSLSISNVNRVALRADLVNYATNLENFISQNDRTWSVADVVGGKTIEPLIGSPIRLPGSPPSSSFPTTCPNQTTSPECRTYVLITMPGASPSQAIKLYTDQVYGHRVTVFSAPSGSQYVPTLLIDGASPACVGQGTCTNTGPPTAAGVTWNITSDVVEPNQMPDSSCGTGITACKTLTVAAGSSYLVSLGVGQVGRGMAEYHRQLLAQARAAGNSDSSELVLGENLAVISYTWLAEASAQQIITNQLTKTTILYNFAVGITGQANIQQTGYSGPYVDLPLNYISYTAQSSVGPTTPIGSFSYPTAFVSAAFTNSEASSAFESAVLEQTQAPVSGMTAASTIKIVDSNMNPSYSGALQTTYFADGTTPSGKNLFNNSIYPVICPTNNPNPLYGSSDCTAIYNAVNTDGQQVLIPKNGMLGVGVWKGAGYAEIFPQSSTVVTTTQRISGGMSGGFTGVNIPDPPPNTQTTLLPPASTDTVPQVLNPIPAPTNPQVLEPVDGITGAYVYRHDDFISGSGGFPYALPFSRTYLSSAGSYLTTTTSDLGIGNGWANTYGIKAEVESDPYIGMGPSDSPATSAASSIAALYVMQDLLSVTPTAQTMTISSMVARWLTDQLTGNVVLVQQPNTTEEFVVLPHADGSSAIGFNPPPGSSVRFNQIFPGQYTYARKDGVTLNFGPTPIGALQSWTFPSGMRVNLSYSGSGKLSRVTNNIGRSLTFSYANNGSDISAVSDDAGRKVGFGYDAQHNLASFSDPMGAITSYAYDTSGTYDTFGHLTQIFYPFRPGNPFVTNWYDPLGRVIQQANASGYRSQFYLAGSRSEFLDAVSNRHVTYQTDRGKVIKDAYVLSPSFGDVFNDTAQQNGVNVTSNQYDGLDRLIKTTLPEAGTTAYTYDSLLNPWANNVASITRTAKPGSPLSPIVTSFSYDPIYNKPIQITDSLGLVTTFGYAPATGNLLSITADAGGTAHFNAARRLRYDSRGKVQSATDPLGIVTTLSYDSFENLISQVTDSGVGHVNATTLYAYDPLGDVVARTDPNGNTTTMRYDGDRRLLGITAPTPFNTGPGLVQTTNAYDADGHLLNVTRVNGSASVVTSISYTATGQVQAVTDPNNNTTTNAYDPDDRLVSVTDPLLRQTIYTYDAMNRRVSVSNPAIQANPLLQQIYTPDGVLGTLTDANGDTTTFTPDGFDRLSTTAYPDNSAENYSYDADSNVLTRQTRKGDTITFSYDTLNRLSTKVVPSEPAVTYAYDLANRLIRVSDTSAAIAMPSASASYAASYVYDQLNRPISASWSPVQPQASPSASTTASFGYTYDGTNRRIGQTATDKSWWSYPTAATNVSYTPNNLNQYTAVGPVTPSYDADGNLTSDGTLTYGYDAENRLISASGTGLSATYAYDAQGRRKSKTVNGTTTVYVTDAENREVLEYNGTSGAIANWYAYALGPNAVLNQVNVASNTRATFIPDTQGSFIGTLDAASGTLTKFGYQAYGESTSANSTFGYTGQRIDPETNGLYYYRARQYMPAWGRFMQADPIGYVGGTNLYAYVLNDPLNRLDPFGRVPDLSTGYTQSQLLYQGQTISNALSEQNVLAGLESFGNVLEANNGALGNALNAAAAATDLTAIPFFGAAESGGVTNLFRAVNPAELEDLTANSGAFRNPLGIENKYFSTTAEGAASYARQTFGTGLYEGPYTAVQTSIPTSAIDPIMQATVDRGISTVTVPTELLPQLSPANPLNFTPLPGGP